MMKLTLQGQDLEGGSQRRNSQGHCLRWSPSTPTTHCLGPAYFCCFHWLLPLGRVWAEVSWNGEWAGPRGGGEPSSWRWKTRKCPSPRRWGVGPVTEHCKGRQWELPGGCPGFQGHICHEHNQIGSRKGWSNIRYCQKEEVGEFSWSRFCFVSYFQFI